MENEVDIITGTLSKAVGSNGGYVTGNNQLIKYLRYYSRTNIFSASLAPAVVGRSESPIIPILIGEDKKAKIVARKLLINGIYIIPAIYPAVRLKDARLRLNVSASHTREDLDYFCEKLQTVNEEVKFAIR